MYVSVCERESVSDRVCGFGVLVCLLIARRCACVSVCVGGCKGSMGPGGLCSGWCVFALAWPNGYGAALLRQRLRVRVPP